MVECADPFVGIGSRTLWCIDGHDSIVSTHCEFAFDGGHGSFGTLGVPNAGLPH